MDSSRIHKPNGIYPVSIDIEQGQEIGKDGRVKLEVNYKDGNYEVEMSGTAIYVSEIEVCI